MEDALRMTLVYGAFAVIGIPIGRIFTAPWLIFLSQILMGIWVYLHYFPHTYLASPEGSNFAGMVPYLWLSMSIPILAGAWVTWFIRKQFLLPKKPA